MQYSDQDVANALRVLSSGIGAIPALSWPASLEGLDSPGLYSWHVDVRGAKELSRGLGCELAPGLIYAGQAGATRWPSGTRNNHNLRGRLETNHLSGNVRGSTLRRTLAACLSDELDLTARGGVRRSLDRGCEDRLSDWLVSHLSVTVFGFDDRDELGQLEELVLGALDPPLNLQGMEPTAIRLQLSKLRKALFAEAKAEEFERGSSRISPASLRSQSRTSKRATLNQEIAAILNDAGNPWMKTHEIALLVNARARYQKRDGSPVLPFQIHLRTRNYPQLFERDGQNVRLVLREPS